MERRNFLKTAAAAAAGTAATVAVSAQTSSAPQKRPTISRHDSTASWAPPAKRSPPSASGGYHIRQAARPPAESISLIRKEPLTPGITFMDKLLGLQRRHQRGSAWAAPFAMATVTRSSS